MLALTIRLVAGVTALVLLSIAGGVYWDLLRSRDRVGFGDFLAILALFYSALLLAAVAVGGSAFLTP